MEIRQKKDDWERKFLMIANSDADMCFMEADAHFMIAIFIFQYTEKHYWFKQLSWHLVNGNGRPFHGRRCVGQNNIWTPNWSGTVKWRKKIQYLKVLLQTRRPWIEELHSYSKELTNVFLNEFGSVHPISIIIKFRDLVIGISFKF